MNLYQQIVGLTDSELGIKRPKRDILDKKIIMIHIAFQDEMSAINLSIVLKCNRKTIYRHLKTANDLLKFNKKFQTKYQKYVPC